MVKKDWQGLSDYGNKLTFRFDESGHLIYKKEIKQIANNWDTTEITYLYNLAGQLIEEKTKRNGGFWIKEYKYNEKGKVVEIINYLMGEQPENEKKIELNRQNITWEILNDSTFRKKIANNFGQPYLAITYTYNKIGEFLLSEEHHLLVTGKKSLTTYQYNKFGWVESVNSEKKKSNYLYDDLGNIVEINTFQNDQPTKHLEYLYHPNGMLEAQLKTENGSSTIHILKYQAEFY